MTQTTKLTGARELEKVLRLLGPRVVARVPKITRATNRHRLRLTELQRRTVALPEALEPYAIEEKPEKTQ